MAFLENKKMTVRSVAYAAATAGLVGFVVDASACSCPPMPSDIKGSDQIKAWQMDKARVIARGRITSLRAVVESARYVSANLRVTSVLKGNVPMGDTELITGFGAGDCGIAGSLLTAIQWDRDIELELQPQPEKPNAYYVDMCGYGVITPMFTPNSPTMAK